MVDWMNTYGFLGDRSSGQESIVWENLSLSYAWSTSWAATIQTVLYQGVNIMDSIRDEILYVNGYPHRNSIQDSHLYVKGDPNKNPKSSSNKILISIKIRVNN